MQVCISLCNIQCVQISYATPQGHSPWKKSPQMVSLFTLAQEYSFLKLRHNCKYTLPWNLDPVRTGAWFNVSKINYSLAHSCTKMTRILISGSSSSHALSSEIYEAREMWKDNEEVTPSNLDSKSLSWLGTLRITKERLMNSNGLLDHVCTWHILEPQNSSTLVWLTLPMILSGLCKNFITQVQSVSRENKKQSAWRKDLGRLDTCVLNSCTKIRENNTLSLKSMVRVNTMPIPLVQGQSPHMIMDLELTESCQEGVWRVHCPKILQPWPSRNEAALLFWAKGYVFPSLVTLKWVPHRIYATRSLVVSHGPNHGSLPEKLIMAEPRTTICSFAVKYPVNFVYYWSK